MDNEQIQIVSNNQDVNTDIRGLYVTIKDKDVEIDTLVFLQEILDKDVYDLFSWKEDHNGTNFCVTGVLKKLISASAFDEVKSIFRDNENILVCEELGYLDKQKLPRQNGLESYNSSWYWPLNKRLSRKEYKSPVSIRIAQADTGISPHPCVIDGFNPGESMNFFLPPSQRKGQGVICWDALHPFFISHGTSTGGLMIGQPRGGLELHGMTEIPGTYRQDVVTLIPCRVADGVVLVPDDVRRLTDCINWAIDEGIKVINISLGIIAADFDQVLQPLKQAIERAYKNGVIVCCASGQIAPGMVWPAIYAMKGWSICCAPSNESGQPSGQSVWPMFSNGYVTIAAPGENMPQAGWQNDTCSTKHAELGVGLGSSYSTAFTSSLAALWWAVNYDILSKKNPRDIVPLFRNTIVKACNHWSGDYPKNYGPGILDPNKVLQPLKELEDYSAECGISTNVVRTERGTYKNVKLYAHHGGSIHVIDPIFVEGKLTLVCETGGTISMSGSVICRELEITCHDRATIHANDLEYYDSCKVDVSVASTCKLHIAAEGPITGRVISPAIYNWSTFVAWIYWRQGRKDVNITQGIFSIVKIEGWNGYVA